MVNSDYKILAYLKMKAWWEQVEGNLAKADDAIMLDQDGFVSETNATNIVSYNNCLWLQSRYFFLIIIIIHLNVNG